jgi:hypothetical protein
MKLKKSKLIVYFKEKKMTLEQIFKKYGIRIFNEEQQPRNIIDVLEDLYLKISPIEFSRIMFEISEEEKYSNIFNNARGRTYNAN